MRLKIKYCWICIFLCVTFSTKAQTVAQLDSLIAKQDYEHANLCAEKIIFMQQLNAWDLANVLIKKSVCLKQQHNFDAAQKTLERIVLFDLPDTMQYQIWHQTALCAYLSGNYTDCQSALEQLNYFTKDSLLKQQSLFLEVLNLNELHRYEAAKKIWLNYLKYKKINADSMLQVYKNYPHLRSETKAQWLELLMPGTGLLYAGAPIEGITTVALQLAALGAGVYLFLNHYYITSFFVGAGLWSTFYQGSLRLTDKRLKEWNQKKAVQFNSKIVKKILQLEKQ